MNRRPMGDQGSVDIFGPPRSTMAPINVGPTKAHKQRSTN